MIPRQIAEKLKSLAQKFPVVALVGPRQSGKTTLVKNVFPELEYISLEEPDRREFALNDPRSFLSSLDQGAIIDEIQRAPQLFSYIQTMVDRKNKPGFFVLTGSQNFLLLENISQTLAGRVAILKLLPFSLFELQNFGLKLDNPDDFIYKGFYPRIYDQEIPPTDWYPNYIQTYVERDIRLIKNVSDLNTFQRFLKMCAGRTGQVLNLSSLGDDCGITHNTAKSWLSILEASFIIFLLRPHYQNFSKRLIKMPKLYFYDTGLACSLLGIEDQRQLFTHYLKGSLFESLIIAELVKFRYNKGLEPNCYFWRDQAGLEIDCLIEIAEQLLPIEIKAGKTITSDYFRNLESWNKLSGGDPRNSFLIYAGDEQQQRTVGNVLSWKNCARVFDD